MKRCRSVLILLLIVAMFTFTFRSGSHTISGSTTTEQERVLDDDYDNAETEFEDWERYIAALDDSRDYHATTVQYLHSSWLSTQGSIRNQQISALSGSVQTTIVGAIASALGIGTKMVMSMYSAYSIEDMLVFHLTEALSYEAAIDQSWDNSQTIEGTDEANSIMEAYRDLEITINHYNEHIRYSSKKLPEKPIKPNKWNLPKFPCGGGCTQEFDTPDSPHWVRCGSSLESVDEEAIRRSNEVGFEGHDHDVKVGFILTERSAAEGCGRQHFNCTPSEKEKHKLRSCTKTIGGNICGANFRYCLLLYDPEHDRRGSLHDDRVPQSLIGQEDYPTAAAPGLFTTVSAANITINGEVMLDMAPGDTVNVKLVLPADKGYSEIYWYLAAPGVSDRGNKLEEPMTPSGTSIETEVSFSFTMPSTGGVYTLTALITPHSSVSDQTDYEYTIKIYCS